MLNAFNTTPTIQAKTLLKTALLQTPCDALILGVFAPVANALGNSGNSGKPAKNGKPELTDSAQTALAALDLSDAALADLPTQLGKTHTVYPTKDGAIKAQRLIFVGLGPRDRFDAKAFQTAVRAAIIDCKHTAAKYAINGLLGEQTAHCTVAQQAQITLATAYEVAYQYDTTLSKKAKPFALAHIGLPVAAAADAKPTLSGAAQGSAIGQGSNFTRQLANLPANICTPSFLAKQAQLLAKTFDMNCEVLERKQLQALKMGSFLSVAAGSDEPPRLIIIKYTGGKKGAAPQVLVGKGVTFDTGGISLKPGEGMDEMKYDMCGAASVLGTLYAAALLKLPINIVGIIPATENMPNGHATKPGDVVTSMSGKTIEILNTDAEGRLILCDALTYAARFKPAAVVDIATLTGACVIALGAVNSGLFANNDNLADRLLAAGQTALDPAWRMPLDDAYQEQLKSNFADLANIGGRPAGSVTAACFLSNFTRDYPWAHLDIAGTAWKSGAAKGATARPVSLLTQYLIDAV